VLSASVAVAMEAIFGATMSPFWMKLDQDVVGFFNPAATNTTLRQAVKHDWPLHRMDHAVCIACTYLAIVVAAKLLFDKGARPAAAAAGDKKKLTVGEKIKKEGFLMFSFVALYNITQVAACGWMVYMALVEHRKRGFKVVCNEHNLAKDGLAFVTHCFYLSKALDFFDTLFMILKNNWRQVSFLHVYHHFSIFLFYWLNAQCNYDGDAYFSIVLNGTIHFIMYGYYFVTTFNITVPLFIKKMITNAQLTQFCCMEAQGVALLYMEGCGSPRNVTIMYMVYISTMLVLFMNFKRQNYKKPEAKTNGDAAKKPNGTTTPTTTVPSKNGASGARNRGSSPAPAAKK
jgi:elongation of very long chain fatty acids protein 4